MQANEKPILVTDGNEIYRIADVFLVEGANTLTWQGADSTCTPVQAGYYRINLISGVYYQSIFLQKNH
ncbi:MAG TPA: hypothetical protein ENI20_05210 [Bacteroides sp.]|nr:hypothetical protein [Bacteroides sp.]